MASERVTRNKVIKAILNTNTEEDIWNSINKVKMATDGETSVILHSINFITDNRVKKNIRMHLP